MSGPLDSGGSRAFALTYLLLEAGAIAGYWLALWLLPDARSAFTLTSAPPGALWSLLPAEAGLVAAALLAAIGVQRRAAWSVAALWLHAGSAVYASLYAFGMAIAEPRLWPGAGLMIPVLVVPLTLAKSAHVSASPEQQDSRWCLVRTGVQTALFWAFFLLIVPVLLKRVESALGWSSPSFEASLFRTMGICIFAAAGAVGLWSGWTLAVVGQGTPLPLDPARRLVIAGPYRFVRNPMALTGVMQGVAVGLWLGSWLVVVYALSGALLWHVVVRPQEERELIERFGPAYEGYRSAVLCWLPRTTPLPRC